MKNSLDFNISYNDLENVNFIQCFATAFMYLETLTDTNGNVCNPDIGGWCSCCYPKCKKDEAAMIRCKFFALFNTMSGNSAIRGHFDGKPTETQKLVGDTDDENHGCGSDFMVDFLFGYAGYDYQKCTDADVFKDKIIAAIDSRKPVIAKVKSGNPRFYLINGYDGDALTCLLFNAQWHKGPDSSPTYDELDVLYIFGDKTTRRYTLKDGLINIRRTMECNIREHVLDGYLTKLGGWDPYPSDDGFDKANPEERAARAARLNKMMGYVFNIVSFMGAFITDHPQPHSHYLHKELWDLDISELANSMNEQHWIIVNTGGKFGGFASKDWLAVDSSELPGISTEICEDISKIKEADIMLLDLINQALELFEKQQSGTSLH